jgi:hypothetical protein
MSGAVVSVTGGSRTGRRWWRRCRRPRSSANCARSGTSFGDTFYPPDRLVLGWDHCHTHDVIRPASVRALLAETA